MFLGASELISYHYMVMESNFVVNQVDFVVSKKALQLLMPIENLILLTIILLTKRF